MLLYERFKDEAEFREKVRQTITQQARVLRRFGAAWHARIWQRLCLFGTPPTGRHEALFSTSEA